MNKQPLPTRKNIRWDKQDYSYPGEYMITICTKNKQKILSEITIGGSQTVGDDVLVVPRTELTKYGKIADKYINRLNDFYSNINVIKYVIMPNHIHLLLQIPDTGNGTTGTSSPTGCQTDERTAAHSVIADFVSTFKRFCTKEYGINIWQRSYHDRVIRDDNDYVGALNYINGNPARWLVREETQ